MLNIPVVLFFSYLVNFMRTLKATSLLEVIIALAITSAAIYGGIQASMKAINTIRDLENRNNAALLLEEIANRVQTNYHAFNNYDKKYTITDLPTLKKIYSNNENTTNAYKSVCYLNNNAPYDYCAQDKSPSLPILAITNITEWLTKVKDELPGGDGIICPQDTGSYADYTSATLSRGCSNNPSTKYLAKVTWKNSNNDDVTQYLTISKPVYQIPEAKNTPPYDKCRISTTFSYNLNTDNNSYGFLCTNDTFTFKITTTLPCTNKTVFDTPINDWIKETTTIERKDVNIGGCGTTALIKYIASYSLPRFDTNNAQPLFEGNTLGLTTIRCAFQVSTAAVIAAFAFSPVTFGVSLIPFLAFAPIGILHIINNGGLGQDWLDIYSINAPFAANITSLYANLVSFTAGNTITLSQTEGSLWNNGTNHGPTWRIFIKHIETTSDITKNCGTYAVCPMFYAHKDYAPDMPKEYDPKHPLNLSISKPICGSDGMGICLDGWACNLNTSSTTKQYLCAGDTMSTCPSGQTFGVTTLSISTPDTFYFCRRQLP